MIESQTFNKSVKAVPINKTSHKQKSISRPLSFYPQILS